MDESKEEIREKEIEEEEVEGEKGQTIEEVLIGLTSAVEDLVKEFQKMVAMQIVLIKYFQFITEEDSEP